MTEASSTRSDVTDRPLPAWVTRGLWTVSSCVLLVNLPIFLCQHLSVDTIMYDLQARAVFGGGVLYRDIVEPNLPGVVGIHLAVRSIAGWSSVAMRAFDLLVLFASLSFLSLLIFGKKEQPRRIQNSGLFCFVVLFFYLGQSEWCQCQRDSWQLCPSLLATLIRRNRMIQKVSGAPSVWYQSTLLEGFIWGLAFWIKPHVAIPAIAVILVSWIGLRKPKEAVYDVIGVVTGGVIAGAIGIGLLIFNGAWEPFWVMQIEWNPEYVKIGRQHFTFDQFLKLYQRLLPWSWIHVGAVLVSVGVLRSINPACPARTGQVEGQRLLVGLYLGWVAQALLIQHPFTYIQVPGIILAIAVVATFECSPRIIFVRRFLFVLFTAAVLPASPLTLPTRLSKSIDCMKFGSTLEVRSKIQLKYYPDWKELKPVLEFLQAQNVQGEDVTVYTGRLIYVYRELDLNPSTRYVYLDVLARMFKTRTGEIHDALTHAEHRFIVSGLLEAGVSREDIDGEYNPQTLLPINFPKNALRQFPYTQPVVFRSGQYLVHRVENPIGDICTEYFPLDQPKRNDE